MPAEVESVLREHDDIADVAVVGLPDPRWGEVVTAVVVPRPGRTPTLDDVVAFSADRLVGYKRPRALHLVGELPRGMTGKVRKHALVEELSREQLNRCASSGLSTTSRPPDIEESIERALEWGVDVIVAQGTGR